MSLQAEGSPAERGTMTNPGPPDRGVPPLAALVGKPFHPLQKARTDHKTGKI
jgi:hypothetical protein